MADVQAKIPSMALDKTVVLWRRALDILGSPAKASQHSQAKLIIAAIHADWVHRRTARGSEEAFAWPSTEAIGGSGNLDGADWLKEGILKFMGYKVGSTEGVPQHIRQGILAGIFSGPLPPAFPNSYLDEWGEPESAGRLKKMAETIASLARNAKRRRDSQMVAAVRDWEKDLEYLYEDYYLARFQFAWPPTEV